MLKLFPDVLITTLSKQTVAALTVPILLQIKYVPIVLTFHILFA